MKKLSIVLLWALLAPLTGCGEPAPSVQTSDGKQLEGDKGISGKVTGEKVGEKTKIAVFGAFQNASGNKIDGENNTIKEDFTIAFAPVANGEYKFSMPKGPQKAHVANFKVFAFNDANDNNAFDEGEDKSKEASVQWTALTGYKTAIDAEGNAVADLFSDFKDFNFVLE